jgi:hypothetical protein
MSSSKNNVHAAIVVVRLPGRGVESGGCAVGIHNKNSCACYLRLAPSGNHERGFCCKFMICPAKAGGAWKTNTPAEFWAVK